MTDIVISDETINKAFETLKETINAGVQRGLFAHVDKVVEVNNALSIIPQMQSLIKAYAEKLVKYEPLHD